MSAVLMKEKLVRLNDSPAYFPAVSGSRVSLRWVWRQATKGSRGRRLESMMYGGVRVTSVEAIGRFLMACNTEPATTPTPEPAASAVQANADCAAAGV